MSGPLSSRLAGGSGERRPAAVLLAGVIVGIIGGAALGVVWWRLAPRVEVVVRTDGTVPATFQPSEYLSADVAFAGLALVAGIAVAIALANMRREHLASVLASSIVSGVLGTAAMWWVGTRLGGVDLAEISASLARQAAKDVVVDGPLAVTMPGVLVLWPLASCVVVTILACGDWIVEARARARSASVASGDGGELR